MASKSQENIVEKMLWQAPIDELKKSVRARHISPSQLYTEKDLIGEVEDGRVYGGDRGIQKLINREVEKKLEDEKKKTEDLKKEYDEYKEKHNKVIYEGKRNEIKTSLLKEYGDYLKENEKLSKLIEKKAEKIDIDFSKPEEEVKKGIETFTTDLKDEINLLLGIDNTDDDKDTDKDKDKDTKTGNPEIKNKTVDKNTGGDYDF